MTRKLDEAMKLLPHIIPADAQWMADIIYSLELKSNDNLKYELATDGYILFYNEHLINGLTTRELMYALIHEAWHIVLEHHVWIKLIPESLKEVYKLACELRVNSIMYCCGWKVHANAPLPGRDEYKDINHNQTVAQYMKELTMYCRTKFPDLVFNKQAKGTLRQFGLYLR